MSEEEDLIKAREELQNALGDRYIPYTQNMRKFFNGKSTKQEFDKVAREIVTDNYVHLHNRFLLCIMSQSYKFSSVANEAATKTIYPLITSKSSTNSSNIRTKKKFKSGEPNTNPKSNSYHLRFIPVDPLKQAPSIMPASIEVASLVKDDFRLEFCARERALPYAKMIHNRMLLTALDYNIQQVDNLAVFLLAEATIYMLKNIITKLSARSQYKHKLRSQIVYELYKREFITDKKILDKHDSRHTQTQFMDQFGLNKEQIKNINLIPDSGGTSTINEETIKTENNEFYDQHDPIIDSLTNDLNNKMIVPIKKLPTNLFDLKSLLSLQGSKSLMPSHSIMTINMEKIICNMWHDTEDDSSNPV